MPESHFKNDSAKESFKNLLNWLNKSWFQWWPIVNEIEIPIYILHYNTIGPKFEGDGNVGTNLVYAVCSATLYSHYQGESLKKIHPLPRHGGMLWWEGCQNPWKVLWWLNSNTEMMVGGATVELGCLISMGIMGFFFFYRLVVAFNFRDMIGTIRAISHILWVIYFLIIRDVVCWIIYLLGFRNEWDYILVHIHDLLTHFKNEATL